VLALKYGESGVILGAMVVRLALTDCALVTVMVYVLVVVLSEAVTTTCTVFEPTVRGMAADVLPEANAVPFTFSVAVASLGTWVTVMLLVVYGAVAVYAVALGLKLGASGATLEPMLLKFALGNCARVTV